MTTPPLARNGRNRRDYRRAVTTLRRTATVCHLCGQGIDPDLPPSHPWAFTADHVVPVGLGGDILGQLQPAHRTCNSRKGIGRTAPQTQPLRTSRRW